MLGPKHFRIEVGYDDMGMLVTISHVPTNQKRSARPTNGETCAKVQDRLRAELIGTFFKTSDFRFQMGRCEVDGRIGDFFSVEHSPSGRSKLIDTIASPYVRNHQQALLDSFLEELWQDGILALKLDA